MVGLSALMVDVKLMRLHALLKVNVPKVKYLTVLTLIAVQNHGLVTDLKTVKIRHMDVT
tara:strand:+ start:52 stop:228 length:177 start_codon:yes stop_codon:yes gene_type:complete